MRDGAADEEQERFDREFNMIVIANFYWPRLKKQIQDVVRTFRTAGLIPPEEIHD